MDKKIVHYRSVSELLNTSKTPMKLSKNREAWEHHKTARRDPDWYGIAGTAADCEKIIVAGWPVALDRMGTLSAHLSAKLPQAEGVARKIVRSDSRGRLDIHAVNSGRLSVAWVSKQRTVTRAPLPVQIIVDVADHAGVGSDSLLWRGVAAMTLSQMLQKAGYLVGIQAAVPVVTNTKTPIDALVLVDVKPIGQRLDMTTLSSTIGFPGFFRSLGFFAVIKVADDCRQVIRNTIGAKINPTKLIEPSTQITQLIVPEKVTSEHTAREWLEECVNMLGGNQ